jgi:hypothetical protein
VRVKNFSEQVYYYTNDKAFTYTAFFADFGPLDLGTNLEHSHPSK